MARDADIDILMGREAVAFIPTDRHEMIRFKLQKYVSPTVLAKLDLSNLQTLSGYISPTIVKEIQDAARLYPEFIDWLVAEDEAALLLHRARVSAARALVDAVEVDAGDDAKLRSVQIKAAEAILKMKNDMPQKVNQTLKISALPSSMKTLAGKSTEDLLQELKQLQESN